MRGGTVELPGGRRRVRPVDSLKGRDLRMSRPFFVPGCSGHRVDQPNGWLSSVFTFTAVIFTCFISTWDAPAGLEQPKLSGPVLG